MSCKSTWHSKRILISILLVTLTLVAQQTATTGTIPNVLGKGNGHTSTSSTSTSTSSSVTTLTTPTGSTIDTIGSTASNGNMVGYVNGAAITASASGVLLTIGLDVDTTGGGNIIVGLYSTLTGTPTFTGLLAQSASTVAVTGWNDLPVTPAVTIVAGTTYYLCFQASAGTQYRSSSGTRYYATFTYGPFVDSTPTLTPDSSQGINMRMTYTSAQGTTTTSTTATTPTSTTTATTSSTTTTSTTTSSITPSTSSTATSTTTSSTTSTTGSTTSTTVTTTSTTQTTPTTSTTTSTQTQNSGSITRISQGTGGYARGVWASGSSLTVTLQQAPVNGDTLILVFGSGSDSTGDVATISSISQTGVTWSGGVTGKQVALNDADYFMDSEIWLGAVGSGAGTTVAINLSGSATYWAVADVCEYSGLAASSVLDRTATSPTGENAVTTGTTATTTQASEVWVGMTIAWNYNDQSVTQSSPTNSFTLLDGANGISPVNHSDYSLAYLEKIVSATGAAGSSTSTANPPNNGADGVIVTLKAAAVTSTSSTATATTTSTTTATTSSSSTTSTVSSATTTSSTTPSTSSTATSTTTSSTTSTTGSTTSSSTTSSSSTAPSEKCSYEVNLSGTTINAQNCSTGAITYSGTNPATVIDDAIMALNSGGSIYVGAGTYTFTTAPVNLGGGNYAAIGSVSGSSDITLYGAGNSTILAAGTNLNAAVLGLYGVNGWYIHDLQVNGNRAAQTDSGVDPPYLWGIEAFDSSNDVIEHCYVHDAKTYGIYVGPGTSDNILDNWVVDNNANGIILYGDSDSTVAGNIVDGASDVGLDISGASSAISSVLAENNTILNVNLGVSPWGLNGGVGILVGDDGAAGPNITVTGNQVSGAMIGLSSDANPDVNTGIIFSSNTVQSTNNYGIYVSYTNGLTVSGNSFTFSAGAFYAVGSYASNIVFENNTVNGVIETQTTTTSG